VTNMDQVKGEVAQLITDIDTEYANVQALAQAASKDARKAAKAKLNVKDINAKVAAAAEAITAAKAANDSGDYAGARDQLNAVKSNLDELKSTLEAAGIHRPVSPVREKFARRKSCVFLHRRGVAGSKEGGPSFVFFMRRLD